MLTFYLVRVYFLPLFKDFIHVKYSVTKFMEITSDVFSVQNVASVECEVHSSNKQDLSILAASEDVLSARMVISVDSRNAGVMLQKKYDTYFTDNLIIS